LQAKDLEPLRQLYTTDIVSFDIDPPLQHVGIAAKLENWARVFHFFETVTYEIRDLTFTVGDGIAFGHAFARLRGTLPSGTRTSGVGAGHLRHAQDQRRLDDRPRPGLGAAGHFQRQRGGRPRALTVRGRWSAAILPRLSQRTCLDSWWCRSCGFVAQ
jgi:ketosteroid isomerase-like protein